MSESSVSDEALTPSQQPFATYYKLLARRTRKRQVGEIERLEGFLKSERQKPLTSLASDAASWSATTYEDIALFLDWLKKQGYQASSIQSHLYTIKTYAHLATNAGFLEKDIHHAITWLTVAADEEGQPYIGHQKSQPLVLSDKEVQQLLTLPATFRGQSDRLLLTLLLFCGLRPREISALNRNTFDLKQGTLRLRNNVSGEYQELWLDTVTKEAAHQYLAHSSPYEALFVGNRKIKGEDATARRLTDRAINDRIRTLGAHVGLPTLSPSDCHAYWEQKRIEASKRWKNADILAITTGPEEESQVLLIEAKTSRPVSPRRRRPDVFNRVSFEESMDEDGVVDSMVPVFVSEARLLFPLMAQFVQCHEKAFLREAKRQREQWHLSQATDDFWEETITHIASWMRKQMQRYQQADLHEEGKGKR